MIVTGSSRSLFCPFLLPGLTTRGKTPNLNCAVFASILFEMKLVLAFLTFSLSVSSPAAPANDHDIDLNRYSACALQMDLMEWDSQQGCDCGNPWHVRIVSQAFDCSNSSNVSCPRGDCRGAPPPPTRPRTGSFTTLCHFVSSPMLSNIMPNFESASLDTCRIHCAPVLARVCEQHPSFEGIAICGYGSTVAVAKKCDGQPSRDVGRCVALKQQTTFQKCCEHHAGNSVDWIPPGGLFERRRCPATISNVAPLAHSQSMESDGESNSGGAFHDP